MKSLFSIFLLLKAPGSGSGQFIYVTEGKEQLLDQSEARADNVRPMRRMEIADMKQEMLVRVSGQNTHTLLAHVWLASVGQSWRACYVRAQNTQRALGLRSQHPQSSQSGVMTLTGPGLHSSAPQAGLG